jgi:hypothetical protein
MGNIHIGNLDIDEIISDIKEHQDIIKKRLSDNEVTADTLKADIERMQNKHFVKQLYYRVIYGQLLSRGNYELKCLCEGVNNYSSNREFIMQNREFIMQCYNSAILCLYSYKACVTLLFQMILFYLNINDGEELLNQQKKLMLEGYDFPEHDLSIDEIKQYLAKQELIDHNEIANSIMHTLMRHDKSLIELSRAYSEIFNSNDPFILYDKSFDVNAIVLDGWLDDNIPHYLRLDRQKIELETLNNFRKGFWEILTEIEDAMK